MTHRSICAAVLAAAAALMTAPVDNRSMQFSVKVNF
jgi:hypothetical protein